MYDDYHRIDANALEHARHEQREFDAITQTGAEHLVGQCDALSRLFETGRSLTIDNPLGKQSAEHGVDLRYHRLGVARLIGCECGIAGFLSHNIGSLLQYAGYGRMIGRNIRHQSLRQNLYTKPLVVGHNSDVALVFGHDVLLGAVVAVIARHYIELRHHTLGAVGKFCEIGHQREIGYAHSHTRSYHRKNFRLILLEIFAVTFYLHILKSAVAVIDDFK